MFPWSMFPSPKSRPSNRRRCQRRDAAPEESTPQETTSQTEDTTSDTTAEAESSQDATAPATTAPTQSLASTVILRVRLQVIQSLRNLTSVFDGSDTEAPSSSSTQHTSGHHSSWHRAGHFHAHDGWAQRQQLDTLALTGPGAGAEASRTLGVRGSLAPAERLLTPIFRSVLRNRPGVPRPERHCLRPPSRPFRPTFAPSLAPRPDPRYAIGQGEMCGRPRLCFSSCSSLIVFLRSCLPSASHDSNRSQDQGRISRRDAEIAEKNDSGAMPFHGRLSEALFWIPPRTPRLRVRNSPFS